MEWTQSSGLAQLFIAKGFDNMHRRQMNETATACTRSLHRSSNPLGTEPFAPLKIDYAQGRVFPKQTENEAKTAKTCREKPTGGESRTANCRTCSKELTRQPCFPKRRAAVLPPSVAAILLVSQTTSAYNPRLTHEHTNVQALTVIPAKAGIHNC